MESVQPPSGANSLTTPLKSAGQLTGIHGSTAISTSGAHFTDTTGLTAKGMLAPHSTGSPFAANKGSLLPRSPSHIGQTPAAAARPEIGHDPTASRHAPQRGTRSTRLNAWQAFALTILALAAAVGVVLWFHLATTMLSSAALRIDGIYTVHRQSSDDGSDGASMHNLQKNVSAIKSVPTMLFDDNAKLAIEAQRRRDTVGKAEKEEATKTGVNLEWQRHHHLDGSVYQKPSALKLSTQKR